MAVALLQLKGPVLSFAAEGAWQDQGSSALKEFLQETKDLWPEIAIVSAVEIADGADELSVSCEHAAGHKCARCWQWKEDVGSNTQYADLCARCAEVLEKEHIQVDGEEKADA